MSNISKIDLNCDLGEGYDDLAIMSYISSCNIACGGHAGDKNTVEQTISLALNSGVAIGVHPSFSDKKNFGRIHMNISLHSLLSSIEEQFMLVKNGCQKLGASLHHFKAHGALYNDMTKDLALSIAVLEKIKSLQPSILIYGMAHSKSEQAAQQLKLNFVREVFADRRYSSKTLLQDRRENGAVITDTNNILQQVDGFLTSSLIDIHNNKHEINAETICLHSDTPSSVDHAKAIYAHLKSKNVTISADR